MKNTLALLVVAVLGSRAAAEDGKAPGGGKPAEPPGMGDAPVVPPAPAAPSPEAADWSAHMGILKFVVGYDAGMDQAWTTGRPAMLFFTSKKNGSCESFGRNIWSDEETTDRLAPYLPVLVDADAEPNAVARYKITRLPSIVWVTYEENPLLKVEGDSTLPEFGEVAASAAKKAPPRKPPVEELILIERIQADLETSLAGGQVKKAISAAIALSVMKRPKASRDAGANALADLDAKGRARLEAAKKALAAGKAAEANAEFQRLSVEYRGRDVGKDAAAALPKDGLDK